MDLPLEMMLNFYSIVILIINNLETSRFIFSLYAINAPFSENTFVPHRSTIMILALILTTMKIKLERIRTRKLKTNLP